MMSRADQNWPEEMTHDVSIPDSSSADSCIPTADSHRTVTYKGWPQLHLAIENLIGAVIAAEVKHGGTMSTNDKLEFVFAMARHSNVNLHDCKRVMRFATTVQRLAETACNRELTTAEILKDEKMQMDIIEILAPQDCQAKFSGDPRGCVVKIQVPDGYTNDWGREGICVPTS